MKPVSGIGFCIGSSPWRGSAVGGRAYPPSIVDHDVGALGIDEAQAGTLASMTPSCPHPRVPAAQHLPISVRRLTGRLAKCKFRCADQPVARSEVRKRPPAAVSYTHL